MSEFKLSILNSIFNINDNTIQPFIDATRMTEQYRDIISKYTFNQLKKLYINNNNVISKLTTCNTNDCIPYRNGLIKWLFYNSLELIKRKNPYIKINEQFYHAAGSSNPTSDYDLTIISKISDKIVKNMFNIFLEITNYKYILPISLDVNLYCKGIFLYSDINPAISKRFNIIKFNINNLKCIDDFKNEPISTNIYLNIKEPTLYSIECLEYNDIETAFIYALIKIVELKNTIVNKRTNLINNKLYIDAKDEYKSLELELKNYNISNKNIIHKIKKGSTIDYIKKLYIMTDYSNKVNNITYSKKSINNLYYKNICKTCYYSIESYYTLESTNIVLLEMQMNIEADFKPHNYICAIIENLGDFNNHFNKQNNFYIEILDKSKNIYRILYSLCKLKKHYNISGTKLACLSGINNNKLEQFIKKCRGKNICSNKDILYNIIELNILDDNKITPKNFVELFNNKILFIIDELLNIFNKSKKQTSKRKTSKKKTSKKKTSKKKTSKKKTSKRK